MRTLMGRLMGGAHDRGADEAGTHEVSRPRASWPSRLFRPEGAPYRSPGQRPGSRGPSTRFPEPCRGDLGLRVANLGLDVSIVGRPFRALRFVWRPVPRALPWARRWAAPLVLWRGWLMGTLMGRLVGNGAHGDADGNDAHGDPHGNGAHDRDSDEAGTHEVSRSQASWPSRLFRPEGALYRSPGQRPGSHDPATPFPEPCRGDLGLRVANLGLDVLIVVRPFRALWFVWRSVPRALPWAAMGRTFGAPDGAADGNAHGAAQLFGGTGKFCRWWRIFSLGKGNRLYGIARPEPIRHDLCMRGRVFPARPAAL